MNAHCSYELEFNPLFIIGFIAPLIIVLALKRRRINKEITQEGLKDILEGRIKYRGRAIISEELFLMMSGELEAYIKLLSLIGSGKLRIRTNQKKRRIDYMAARRILKL